jgi:hypothetical protein
VAFGAVALNIGTIQDAICEKAGLCTAQQKSFRIANECVAHATSCAIDACLRDFRKIVTLPRLIERMDPIETAASISCRNEETASYQRARVCADRAMLGTGPGNTGGPCAVAACYTPYLSGYPNGEFIREARGIVSSARQACNDAAATPPPVVPPSAQARPPQAQVPPQRPGTPAVALPDGTYTAVRTFVEAKSISDPASCPPSTTLQVTVRGSTLSFENLESNTGINRKWKGTIKPDGKISFLGSEATPPTTNYLTILGDYDSADINSRFCGKGYFKIMR